MILLSGLYVLEKTKEALPLRQVERIPSRKRPVQNCFFQSSSCGYKKGVVIDSQRRGNGNYDRIIVAAPITIAKESYIMGVMLQRDKQSQRLYLHDVVAISKKETTKVGEVTPITTETATLNDSLYMTSILLKAYNVKEKTTYPNAKYSKDDTIFDDFADEEVMFTADGDIAFDGFGADAQRTIDVKEMVQEQGAEHAVYTLYNAAARTAEKAIKGHSGIQLGEQNYERIAEKLLRQLKTVTITIQINGLDSVTRAVCFFD